MEIFIIVMILQMAVKFALLVMFIQILFMDFNRSVPIVMWDIISTLMHLQVIYVHPVRILIRIV
jgi:hypothetical protein